MSIPNDGPFHQVGTTCQFCKKPITLEIADSYDEVSDPHKLIPLACCNHCADIRVERRSLEAKIKFICKMRLLDSSRATKAYEKDRSALEKLLKQYAHLIARWHFMDGMSWDEAALDLIMDKPAHWFDILGTLWRIFKDANPERV